MDRSRLLALVAIVAAAVGLWVVAPEVYTGTVSSWATFLRVLLLVAALVAWVVGVRRVVGNRTIATVLALAPVLVAAWVYVWPYLRPPTEVDEAFPITTAPSPEAEPTTRPTRAVVPTPGPTPFPTGEAAGATETPAATPAPTATPTPAPTPAVVPTASPTEPVELRRGSFQGLTGHRGSGDAALYRLPDGSILLRFEEVDIGSGPALNVYVVPGQDQRRIGDGTFVAPLTAERGNQNYTLPAAVDLTVGSWTVLVWCETFVVEVANATLAGRGRGQPGPEGPASRSAFAWTCSADDRGR